MAVGNVRARPVEVQQSFYKLPRLETAGRWRQEAPPGFEFALKAWQLITHPASSPTYRRAGLNIAAGRPADVLFNNLRMFDDALAFSRLLANVS